MSNVSFNVVVWESRNDRSVKVTHLNVINPTLGAFGSKRIIKIDSIKAVNTPSIEEVTCGGMFGTN